MFKTSHNNKDTEIYLQLYIPKDHKEYIYCLYSRISYKYEKNNKK